MGYYKANKMSHEPKENIPEGLLKAILELNSLIIIGLSILEYSIRESMVRVFLSTLGPNWLTHALIEPAIPIFKIEALIIEKRHSKHFVLTENKFVEEASMGFWVELFNRETYKQLKGIPIQAVKYRPPSVKRSRIYQTFKYLKDLRNLLVHNRLLLTSKKEETIHLLQILQKADNDIRTLISYINPSAINLLPQEINIKISEIEKLLR